MHEIAALSPGEQERLPDHIFRRFCNWQLQQRWQKPVLSEDAEILKALFEQQGFAFSAKNSRTVQLWMNSRGLGYSPSNIEQAILVNESALDQSEAEMAQMGSREYRERVVNPELRELQAKQPKPEPSRVPFGIRTTRYIHER